MDIREELKQIAQSIYFSEEDKEYILSHFNKNFLRDIFEDEFIARL